MEIKLDTEKTIRKEIYQFQSEVIDEFNNNYHNRIEDFVTHMKSAYSELGQLGTRDEDEKAGFSILLLWACSSLLQSFKLFCHGYQAPSGNLMRHSIEAIAFCMHATDKTNMKMADFTSGKATTNGAARKLDNRKVIKKLGLEREAVKRLHESQKFYDRFSHPSLATIASCLSFENEGDVYVGGSFDQGKKAVYDQEIELRVSLARDLSATIKAIRIQLESW